MPSCAKAIASPSRTVMRRFSEASPIVAPPVHDFDGAFQSMVVSEASTSTATVASEDPHRQPCGERRPKLLASAELVGTYHLGRQDRLRRLGVCAYHERLGHRP